MRFLSSLVRRLRGELLDRPSATRITAAALVPSASEREFAGARRRFALALLSKPARIPLGGLRRWEWGQSAPLLAAAMGFVVVVGVMTLDVGLLLDERREAQAAADFAALAAAQDLPADPLDPQLAAKLATAEATASDYLRRNGFDPADADVTASITTNYNGGVDQIEVVVNRPRAWVFGKIFGLAPITIQGRAVARADSVPRDIMVVLDRSGSMSGQPFDQVRDAATAFSDSFRPFVGGQVFDQMALVSYASEATLELGLTTDFGTGSAYETAIDGMSASGRTNIGHAIYLARTELEANAGRGAQQVIVLLTDGLANRYLSGGTWDSPSFSNCSSSGCSAADDDAIEQAQIAAGNGIAIYTIGFTGNAGFGLMQQIANIGATQGPGGQFFDVTDPIDLEATFAEIAGLLSFALVE